MPAEAHSNGLAHAFCAHDDGVPGNLGLRLDELLVLTGNREPSQRLAVCGLQPAFRILKQKMRLTAFDLEGIKQWARITPHGLIVSFCQRPQGEAVGDGLLVRRMDVADGGDIGDHSHARVSYGQRGRLGFPDSGEVFRLVIAIRCKLDEKEREITLLPNRSPAIDQRLHLLEVEHSFAIVRFALIPQRSADRIRDDGMDHRIIHCQR